MGFYLAASAVVLFGQHLTPAFGGAVGAEEQVAEEAFGKK